MHQLRQSVGAQPAVLTKFEAALKNWKRNSPLSIIISGTSQNGKSLFSRVLGQAALQLQSGPITGNRFTFKLKEAGDLARVRADVAHLLEQCNGAGLIILDELNDLQESDVEKLQFLRPLMERDGPHELEYNNTRYSSKGSIIVLSTHTPTKRVEQLFREFNSPVSREEDGEPLAIHEQMEVATRKMQEYVERVMDLKFASIFPLKISREVSAIAVLTPMTALAAPALAQHFLEHWLMISRHRKCNDHSVCKAHIVGEQAAVAAHVWPALGPRAQNFMFHLDASLSSFLVTNDSVPYNASTAACSCNSVEEERCFRSVSPPWCWLTHGQAINTATGVLLERLNIPYFKTTDNFPFEEEHRMDMAGTWQRMREATEEQARKIKRQEHASLGQAFEGHWTPTSVLVDAHIRIACSRRTNVPVAYVELHAHVREWNVMPQGVSTAGDFISDSLQFTFNLNGNSDSAFVHGLRRGATSFGPAGPTAGRR